MKNLFKDVGSLQWMPDADEVGAPPNALLVADNTVPDKTGARALRGGSRTLYNLSSDPSEARVSSLYAAILNGIMWRMAGAGNRVFANGTPLGAEFDGVDDIVFGDDSYQIFAARGSVAKKWDGTTFNNWSIAPPSVPPSVLAVNATTVTVASFNSAESPAFVINEGTSGFVAGHDGTANEALRLTGDTTTGRASASKKFASDQDFFNIGGVVGGGTDLFDFRVWFEDWRKVEKITIMFGLGTGTDPYKDDYYYFDFNIRVPSTVDIKDPSSNAAAAYKLASSKSLSVLTPQQVTNVRSPEKAAEILRRLGRFAGPRSTERRDALEASPAWGHLAVTRGQFNRVGGTAGRNWQTVRGFKVVYTVTPGATDADVYLDDAIWTGGGSRALTGTFTVGYRFARKFTTPNEDEVYYELSPMSTVSPEITLNQQVLQVTIPALALAAKDAQVGEVWVYLQGGWLDTYYRFAVLPANPNTGMTIDELAQPVGSDFNTPEKRTRLTSWGFTNVEGMGGASLDVVFSGAVSELEILIDNEPYIPGATAIPNDIVAIAGPWNGRMFILDAQGYLWPTSDKYPSGVSAYHAIDLRRYGSPLWMVMTSGGVYAGFTDDIIRVAGTGDEADDHITVDLWGEPLGVGSPPVDRSVMVDGNTVVYRSADGPMVLAGSSLQAVPFAGTELLWKGTESRYGIEPVNVHQGRFRFENDNHVLHALVSEGSNTDPNAIWSYNKSQWSRKTYPFIPISIYRAPDGALLVGAGDGTIREIEYGDTDDNSSISVSVVMPYGGDPLNRKEAADLQVHVDTGGVSGTVTVTTENASLTQPMFSSGPNVFRSDVTSLGTFLRAKVSMAGTFNKFLLRGYNITYREIPQETMAVDLGYVVPPDGMTMSWVIDARLDCVSPSDVLVRVYHDDVLRRTLTVPITSRIRTEYKVDIPKGTKSRRLRFVLVSANGAGYNDPGFELYSFKVKHRGHGNWTELIKGTGDAA